MQTVNPARTTTVRGPYIRTEIPLVVMFRALGIVADRDILERIVPFRLSCCTRSGQRIKMVTDRCWVYSLIFLLFLHSVVGLHDRFDMSDFAMLNACRLSIEDAVVR